MRVIVVCRNLAESRMRQHREREKSQANHKENVLVEYLDIKLRSSAKAGKQSTQKNRFCLFKQNVTLNLCVPMATTGFSIPFIQCASSKNVKYASVFPLCKNSHASKSSIRKIVYISLFRHLSYVYPSSYSSKPSVYW